AIRVGLQHDDPRGDFGAQRVGLAQAALMDEAHEATCAVAAVFDFTSIGIENAIAKVRVGTRGGFDEQHLVGSDAQLPVRQGPYPLLGDFQWLRYAVEHNEVVARAVHLCEFPVHTALSHQSYRPGSPGGRVLNRLCTQWYWLGWARTHV